jgi:hypothetical protein
MARKQSSEIDRLIREHGGSFSGELGINLSRNTPSVLFRWFCASLLLSARINHDVAMRAAAALAEHHWTTAGKLRQSKWEDRVKVLNAAGYARYDESTARMLGEAADKMLHDYGGDLRRLRSAAGRNPDKERVLLKEFKGIGEVGCDIFFRELQDVWEEQYPFMDQKARLAAEQLGLPQQAAELAKSVGRDKFQKLVTALTRYALEKKDDAGPLLGATEGPDR